jgi:hypothetical protein
MGPKARPGGEGGEVLVLNCTSEVARLRVFKSLGCTEISLIIAIDTRVGLYFLE